MKIKLGKEGEEGGGGENDLKCERIWQSNKIKLDCELCLGLREEEEEECEEGQDDEEEEEEEKKEEEGKDEEQRRRIRSKKRSTRRRDGWGGEGRGRQELHCFQLCFLQMLCEA